MRTLRNTKREKRTRLSAVNVTPRVHQHFTKAVSRRGMKVGFAAEQALLFYVKQILETSAPVPTLPLPAEAAR